MSNPPFTLDNLIGECREEIRYREKCYPRWVTQGKMSPRTAETRLAMMKQILTVLENQKPNLFNSKT